ncbi:MAG: SCP2 sterol-binding domain-containing protein [Saprospiraceae bacterium]|nr:SCP2 sterol-binding domain-containing protein [Saprospiraceae bacterium]
MTAAEFIRDLPRKFNPEAVPGAETCFHFIISGEGGGEFTAYVKDSQCSVQDGLHDSPKCVIRTSAQVLMDIVTGKKNPQMAVLTKELNVSNLAEMMKFAKPFGML